MTDLTPALLEKLKRLVRLKNELDPPLLKNIASKERLAWGACLDLMEFVPALITEIDKLWALRKSLEKWAASMEKASGPLLERSLDPHLVAQELRCHLKKGDP